MTLKTIIAAVVQLAMGWQKNDTLNNDLTDAALLLGTVHSAGVDGAQIDGAIKIVSGAQAGLANLQSGQAAVVAHGSYKGQGYSLVLVADGGPAAQSLGL